MTKYEYDCAIAQLQYFQKENKFGRRNWDKIRDNLPDCFKYEKYYSIVTISLGTFSFSYDNKELNLNKLEEAAPIYAKCEQMLNQHYIDLENNSLKASEKESFFQRF